MSDKKSMTQKRLAEIKRAADHPLPASVSAEGKIIKELLAEIDMLREAIWDIKIRLSQITLA